MCVRYVHIPERIILPAIKLDSNHSRKLWIIFIVLTTLWDFVFIIYEWPLLYRITYFLFQQKAPGRSSLSTQISVGLTDDEGNKKKDFCDNNLQKVCQKHQCLQQMQKTLPSWPNELTTVEDVYPLDFLPGNFRPKWCNRSSAGILGLGW
jgi:hypothetical protein